MSERSQFTSWIGGGRVCGRLTITTMVVVGVVGLFASALCTYGDPGVDEVLAEFQSHLGGLTNADVTYIYRQTTDPRIEAPESVGNYDGHWLYANGSELIDFRADKDDLAALGQVDRTKTLRLAATERVFEYDKKGNYTVFYNPLTQTAQVDRGRKVRGWPPSDFMWLAPRFSQMIVDLIRSNKTAALITPLKPRVDPMIIEFRHPRNNWAKYDLSLSPSKDYRPVKIQLTNMTTGAIETWDVQQVLINGVWFPAAVDYQDTHADGKGDKHVNWMCTEVHLNQPAFDPARLKVRLPVGTKVGDAIHKATVQLDTEEEVTSFLKSLSGTEDAEK